MTDALNVLSATAIMIIVASGLALILGLMNVINLAHPASMAIGAYAMLVAAGQGTGFWGGVVAGAVAAGIVGLGIEMLIIRRLYDRPFDTILATWGIALVVSQVITIIFGRAPKPVDAPMTGILTIAGISYSEYRLTLMGVAVLLVVALAAVARYTKWGLIARAVMANESLAAGLGINTRTVRRVTFVFGSALGGIAGALIAPLSTITPMVGFGYLIPAFLAVLLSGSAILGLVAAALIVAGGDSLFSRFISAIFSMAFVTIIVISVLRFFTNGFERLRRIA